MFTGIVQATGRIAMRQPAGDGARIRVEAVALQLADVAVGDSIAVAGCCLTVVAVGDALLDFDVSAETLRCTTGFVVGQWVNLEKALRLSDRLGGHLMSGHVDGIGVVAGFVPVNADRQGSWRLDIDMPPALARYVATKGSIAVDGASLTVNAVVDSRFTVNVIPHTLARTTIGRLVAGTKANLEVDLIARYAQRMLQVPEENRE
jgi:riboflavin synthase